MDRPHLAADIEKLIEKKEAGALTDSQFNVALAMLSPDTAPSLRLPQLLPQLLTTILGGTIALVGTGILGIGGWMAVKVIDLNRGIGVLETRVETVEESNKTVREIERKLVTIEILYGTLRGQADARRQHQEESQR